MKKANFYSGLLALLLGVLLLSGCETEHRFIKKVSFKG
ncbi:MAG: NADH-quinone reductase, partial [Thermoplasmata archaeon]